MNIKELKKEEEVIRKLEKSIHILYENININKNNNFSILNLLTFTFLGWGATSFVIGTEFLIPLTITAISLSIWVYLANFDNSKNMEGEFNKYTVKKFKKISNSNQLIEVFNSSLTKEERDLLNKVFKNIKSEKRIFINYFLNNITYDYIIANKKEFFDYIGNIKFISEEEKESFKYKLADKLHLDISMIRKDDFNDIRNKLVNESFKDIKIKSKKLILKSI